MLNTLNIFSQTFTRNLPLLSLMVGLVVVLSATDVALFAPPASAKIQQAPNSRVVLDLPQTYRPSPLFSGFQNDTNGVSYVILEAPRDAYDKMKTGFTAENLAKRGITNVKPGTLTRNGENVYMRGRQSSAAGTYAKFFVIFPTSDQTILISVNVPLAAITSGEVKPGDVEKVLASATTVAKADISDLYEFAYLGPFKEAGRFVGTSKAYTLDGRLTPSDPAQTRAIFIVAPSIDKRQIGDGAAAAKTLLTGTNGYVDMKLGTPKPVTIAGLKGFELEASAKDEKTSAAVRILQTLLIGASGGYYRMMLITPQDQAEALLSEARKISRSFKLKP